MGLIYQVLKQAVFFLSIVSAFFCLSPRFAASWRASNFKDTCLIAVEAFETLSKWSSWPMGSMQSMQCPRHKVVGVVRTD